MLPFLIKIGFKKNRVTFVPISGLQGVNLNDLNSRPEALNKWYRAEEGYYPQTLVDIIDNFKPRKKPFNKPIRVSVYQYFNKPKDGFSIVTGDSVAVKIESGVIK